MSKKIIWGVIGIVVLVAVFYGGVSYGKSQAASAAKTAYAGAGARIRGGGGAGGGFGGLTSGQILSKDAQSMTIKLGSGGSEIVFVDSNTKISKQASGSLSDLTVGTNVSVAGTANSDGSLTAQMVQIRPVGMTRPTQAVQPGQ
jgi:hypothetical protein